jgi:hypothetical protein
MKMKMTKRFAATCAVLGALVAPLSAELKYTMHVESHPSKAPAGTPDPLMSMASATILQNMLPAGPTDVTCVLGTRGTRCEAAKALSVLPAGTVILVKPDGSTIALNPTAKTFWKLSGPTGAVAQSAGVTPDVKETKTGEKATIAGVPTERVSMVIRVPFPVPAGAQLPEGMPKEFVITADKWMTHQYDATYKAALDNSAAFMGMSGLGGKTTGEGFIMRQVVRGAMFGDQEIEMVVTKIAEGPADASLFDVPAGYKEVPAPTGRIGGL